MHLNPHSLLLRESGKARLNRHTMKKLSYLRRDCLAGPSGPGGRCTGPRALGSIPVGRLPWPEATSCHSWPVDRATGAREAQTPVVHSPGSTRPSCGGQEAMVSVLRQKLKAEAWQGHILGGDLQSMGAREWGSLEWFTGCCQNTWGAGVDRRVSTGGRHTQLVEERDP